MLDTKPPFGSVPMPDDESTDPSSPELQPFAYQVGGHKGIQVTGGGDLIVKATLPLELQFYQNLLADPALSPLRQWTPTYLGTLRLEGKYTAEGLVNVEGAIVIENVAHGFRKPNIIDIKLGTVLYDEDASPAKKERSEIKTRCTTSGETGIRLTGFQVFGNKSSQPLVVPKDYGRSIRAAELAVGIARAFPVHESMTNLPGAHPGGLMDVGLPVSLLLPILRAIRRSVQELRDVLNSIELRLIGSSLLIVYEGDWDHAEVGVQWLANHPASVTGEEGRWKEEEICSDAEGEVEEVEGSEVESEEGDDDDEEEDERSDCPCVVRLIDFAHTRLKLGQGPDLGVLKGLDTLLNLLDGRITALVS